MKNIVLIGMPGVGKSTIGVVLAKNLGMAFIDSDLVIQEQEDKRLHELIAEHGIDGFIKIENDVFNIVKRIKEIETALQDKENADGTIEETVSAD